MTLIEQRDGIGNYVDVTGVVDATAAPEIVALITELKRFLPNPDDRSGIPMPSPDFMNIHPHTVRLLRAEIDAVALAISVAPTV